MFLTTCADVKLQIPKSTWSKGRKP
jgi:hypothetical protein